MTNKRRLFLQAAMSMAAFTGLSSCATYESKPHVVLYTSDPIGAKVICNNIILGLTPLELTLLPMNNKGFKGKNETVRSLTPSSNLVSDVSNQQYEDNNVNYHTFDNHLHTVKVIDAYTYPQCEALWQSGARMDYIPVYPHSHKKIEVLNVKRPKHAGEEIDIAQARQVARYRERIKNEELKKGASKFLDAVPLFSF